MKKFSIQLVFICVLFFMYYFYNAWVNSLDKTDLMFQLFDPFKLILLGMIFTVIYGAIKNLLFSRFVNLKSYRKNLRNNILFEFENTITYIQGLKKIIDHNDVLEAKKALKHFKTISYKPIYLSDFMEVLANALLMEKDISVYSNSVEVILENINTNFKLERERTLKNQKGMMEIKMSESYFTNSSWDSIKYNLALNNLDNSKSSRWKISSLYISKFKNSLFISFMINTLIFAFVGIGMYLNKTAVNNYVFVGFIASLLIIAMVHYNVSIFMSSKKMDINIYWSHLLVYYLIITIIFANIILNIVFFPKVSPDQESKEAPWYNSELLNFLKNLLYIVFSTMLLTYVFGGLLELLENSKFNWKNSIEAFILPLVIFITTLVINILSIKSDDNSLYIINFAILILFWVFIGIWNKFFSK
ncbi:hypothetical protein [Spiroplasma floricola]|uniref:Uncharacterized protein n=1 Tax=Spiroplasma floricola 23-6 TaxID=1336749 RepID=A0A2K8SDI0_9MOLU|nr:hypothetical protein [Spiroplasma floricola]AUB31405.1 hypothetical protein SFLOR_v1c03480 [Spiroplasma floricola 23-6]